MVSQEILDVRANAERLYDMATVEHAVDRMAASITAALHDKNPLLLTVMTGGIVPAGMLLQRLDFPLQLDYIHVSRYGDKTTGGDIDWVRPPPAGIEGRTVLLVDDLLDHGLTLQAAAERCLEHGAATVLTAVLFVKQILRAVDSPAPIFMRLKPATATCSAWAWTTNTIGETDLACSLSRNDFTSRDNRR